MGSTMPLKNLAQLHIGKVDGKYEYIETAPDNGKFFDTFLIPENVNVSEYLSGDKYLVLGFRGTGKRHLCCGGSQEKYATMGAKVTSSCSSRACLSRREWKFLSKQKSFGKRSILRKWEYRRILRKLGAGFSITRSQR